MLAWISIASCGLADFSRRKPRLFRPRQARTDGPNILNGVSPGNFGEVGRLDMPDMEGQVC